MSIPRAARSVATSTRSLPRLKSASARVALRLRAIAVDPLGRHVVLLEREREPVGPRLRAGERDRAVDAVVFEQLDEQIGLALLRDVYAV